MPYGRRAFAPRGQPRAGKRAFVPRGMPAASFSARVARVVRDQSDNKIAHFRPSGLDGNDPLTDLGVLFEPLDQITRGTENNQRVGNKIYLQHVDILINLSSISTTLLSFCRVLILWSPTALSSANMPAFSSLLDRNLNPHCMVLRDWKWVITTTTGSGSGPNQGPVATKQLSIKLNRPTTYVYDSTGTDKGHLYLWAVSSTPVATPTLASLISCDFQISYKDC